MATSPGCLCLVLTLWIAVLRPSAAVRTGSPDSVWWGTKESARLQDLVRKQIKTGNIAAGKALLDKRQAEAMLPRDQAGLAAIYLMFASVPALCSIEEGGKIPSEPWAEATRFLRTGPRKNPASDRFRLRLSEVEAQAEPGVSLNPVENFPSGDSLIHFQQGLRVPRVLPNLDLEEKVFPPWVTTQNARNACRVAAREWIRGVVRKFHIADETGWRDTAVQSGRPERLLSLIPRLGPIPKPTLSVERIRVARWARLIVKQPLAVEHPLVTEHPLVAKKEP